MVMTGGEGTNIASYLSTLSALSSTSDNLSVSATAIVDAIRVEQEVGDPFFPLLFRYCPTPRAP